PTDTAVELRGTCALGLVRIGHRETMTELVRLLVDPSPVARVAAIRAIAYSERDEGALLLRLKALTGDREPEVTAECFTALAKLAPEKSIPFIGEFLAAAEDVIAESAALALGETRRREAFDLLRERW